MQAWLKWLIGIIIVIFIGMIIYFSVTKEEKYFDKIELPQTTMVVNKTSHNYLDSIVYVGVHELNLTPTVVIIKELNDKNQPKTDLENMKLEAYIIGENHQYIINIRKMSRASYIKVLAHELIHLEQREQGRYVALSDKIIFEDIVYNINNIPEYDVRPWEIESYQREGDLNDKIKAILYSTQ